MRGENDIFFLQFSANIFKTMIDEMKLSIAEMIIIIRPTKVSRDQSCPLKAKKSFLLFSVNILKTRIDWTKLPIDDKSYQSLHGVRIVGVRVIAIERPKFNKVSDSGSWEPLVQILMYPFHNYCICFCCCMGIYKCITFLDFVLN